MKEWIEQLINDVGLKMLPEDGSRVFHHFGLACRDLDSAINVLEQNGYFIGPFVDEHQQKVKLSICTHAVLPCLEIVFSDDASSPINQIIQAKAFSIYHICYAVPDREQALAEIAALGHRYITTSQAKKTVLFEGDSVSFHFSKGTGLFELLEISNYEHFKKLHTDTSGKQKA